FNFQYNPGFSYVQAAKSNQLNGPFTGQNFNQNNFRSNYNNRSQSRGPQRTNVNFNQSSNSNQNNASSNKGKEVPNKSIPASTSDNSKILDAGFKVNTNA